MVNEIGVLGLLFVVIGLVNIFARDAIWKLHKYSYDIKGIKTERTQLWDSWTIVRGMIFVLIGLIMMIFSG